MTCLPCVLARRAAAQPRPPAEAGPSGPRREPATHNAALLRRQPLAGSLCCACVSRLEVLCSAAKASTSSPGVASSECPLLHPRPPPRPARPPPPLLHASRSTGGEAERQAPGGRALELPESWAERQAARADKHTRHTILAAPTMGRLWAAVLLLAALLSNSARALLITSVPLQALLRPSMLSGETPTSMECIYSAAENGWSAQDFHNKVDYNPPLPSLVLARAKGSRAVVGCFNPIGWQSRDDYRDSLRTFIFRIEGSTVQFSTKLQGGPAIYDFGDRAIWLQEALDIPLNPKYMGRRRARSSLSSSFSALSPPVKGVTGLFNGLEVELSDLEVYTSKSLLRSSRPMSGTESGGKESVFSKIEKLLFGNN